MAKTAPAADPVASPAAVAPAEAVARVSPDGEQIATPQEVATAPMLRITARVNGFRRAGVAHAATPTDWPADAFSDEQIASLLAEPNLVVALIDADPAGA